MRFLDLFNGYYQLESQISKNQLIDAIQFRIETAFKQAHWLNFDKINYKNFVLRDDILLIFKKRATFGSFTNDIGRIKVKFNSSRSGTLLEVKTIPFGDWKKIIFWGNFIPGLLLGSFIALFIHGYWKYLIILLLWIFILVNFSVHLLLCKYGLKQYLKKVLRDLAVDGALITVDN